MSIDLHDLPPPVLSFAASDATGGDGLQSDVLTLASMGCHPLSVLAAVIVRDTRGVEEVLALDAEAVAAQARALLEDIPVRAFKLGMVGSVENVAAIAEILSDYPDLPLVVAPSLGFVDGDESSGEDLLAGIAELVLPQTTVLVASRDEVLQLAAVAPDPERFATDEGEDDAELFADEGGGEVVDADLSVEDAINHLLALGVRYILLTGTSEPGPQVVNVLVNSDGPVRTDAWDRLPERFLGAGSTLAAALAAALAHGMEVPEAVREAQEFTWQALSAAYRPGMGLALPDRLFWARPEDEAATEAKGDD
ncbi:MAG TPA: bifunctional hydroxymethylpyrimidine kinase/phosphomethylpyrimidine kinase [Aromatoleum sp.]|uniref:bifunctional hydroxymethylpyrimidine kinase/phosphomethylpyrimidine kinase n=1 Tax=Aromatoleum sp. TaxID=2307007 RepID=UPI002B47325F|nr:bifunctional hydroxymethylpyrimidine kinase/phosphomethylpyrimidine kinase [Aromatoleum sp.]HJV28549.1 bifunctional hydroxymethylpyrimidine kinase/phosphomethylpyrimidine kinase [Aromatoleum sp.]